MADSDSSIDFNVSPPSISGSTNVGSTLTASASATGGATSVSFSYQWKSSSDGTTYSNLSGATASVFIPSSEDSGKYLKVEITASNASGSQVSISEAVGPIVTGSPSSSASSPAVGLVSWKRFSGS